MSRRKPPAVAGNKLSRQQAAASPASAPSRAGGYWPIVGLFALSGACGLITVVSVSLRRRMRPSRTFDLTL